LASRCKQFHFLTSLDERCPLHCVPVVAQQTPAKRDHRTPRVTEPLGAVATPHVDRIGLGRDHTCKHAKSRGIELQRRCKLIFQQLHKPAVADAVGDNIHEQLVKETRARHSPPP
jgi:hypothetical protein